MIKAWILTVILISDVGGYEERSARFDTFEQCETQRQKIWIAAVQKFPFAKIETSCKPVIVYHGNN